MEPNSTATFARFLNFVLALLLLVSVFIAYHFGNFDGVSLDELRQNYIEKNSVIFKDLPKKIQDNYIDKTSMQQIEKNNLNLENEYFNENGSPISESDASEADLRNMVKKLQKKLLFLQHDNLVVANEKNELTKILNEQKSIIEQEKNRLSNNNLEKINDIEQQHYKNISDLTLRINELQKENVAIAQRANIENNSLKNEIEQLKNSIVENNEKKAFEIKQAVEQEKMKTQDDKEKIKVLNDQIALLNEQIALNKDSNEASMLRKDEEVSKMREEVKSILREKNEILKKNTQNVLDIEQKHNMAVDGFNKTIDALKKEQEKISTAHKQEMVSIEEEHQRKIAEHENVTKNMRQEMASIKKNAELALLGSEKEINKLKTYLQDEKKINEELKANLTRYGDEKVALEKNMLTQISKMKNEIVQKESQINELNTQMENLKGEKLNFDVELKKNLDINNEKHNKNYRAFNEKIASLESEKRDILQQFNTKINEYKNLSEKNFTQAQSQSQELQKTNIELKEQNETLSKTVLEQKNKILALESDIKSKSSNTQTLSAKDEKIASLENDIKQKEARLVVLERDLKNSLAQNDENIQKLTQKIKELEKNKAQAQEVTPANKVAQKTEKLKLLDKVVCADMPLGSNIATPTCKAEVEKFLQKYDTSYFFEVAPIVDGGGFASLNTLKAGGKSGIADTEIDRISGLANIGLGKDRAKVGGLMIRSKYGESAKVSYTLYNVEKNSSRGFEIRVYK
ncbi:MAG: hypothetical protein PHN38_02170 [Sulfurospirillaceae bacterium]|nr:hypothetical protein [Sulfurospirillaceae bacterium]